MKSVITILMLSIIILCLSTTTVKAQYNANTSGILSGVLVYTDSDHIYLRLENQPTEHPTCNPSYFAIDASVPLERRQMLLSRLLSAYAMKEKVNIGYDSQGDCANGYIRVHRAG